MQARRGDAPSPCLSSTGHGFLGPSSHSQHGTFDSSMGSLPKLGSCRDPRQSRPLEACPPWTKSAHRHGHHRGCLGFHTRGQKEMSQGKHRVLKSKFITFCIFDFFFTKGKGEKERYTHLNAEFPRIARRDKPSSVINVKK